MSILVKRLVPGDDLLAEIESLVHGLQLRAGVLLSVVGSLKVAKIRFANQDDASAIAGPLEIVSGTGTVCDSGSHIHIAVSDSQGKTLGGHLKYGSLVFTTVELVIQDFSNEWIFERKYDPLSGNQELFPTKANSSK